MELQALGRYRLVAQMPVAGTGSTGARTVDSGCRFFLARHEDEPEDGPPSYLVKLQPPPRGGNAARLRAQFDHEVKLLQTFNHPCIPSVHAAGEQDGVPYVVMDRVDGIDLATLLGHATKPRALSKTLAVYVMGQLVDALRHIHTAEVDEDDEPLSLDVVHRDVCPDNILISRRGDVVLVDFGSARSRWLPEEHDDAQAGTLAYMAPERVGSSGRATDKSDLFSAAVVLWEALRGQRCFPGPDDAAVREAIEHFDVSQSSRRVTGLSAKLGEILRKNLDRDPSRRYLGAYQMLQRLAQAPEAQSAEQARLELAARVGELNGP